MSLPLNIAKRIVESPGDWRSNRAARSKPGTRAS